MRRSSSRSAAARAAGGHIAIEAAPHLPDAAGFLVYGTPPVTTAAQMPEAFLPNPVLNVGFTAEISRDDAEAYASSFVAPGSALNTDDAVTDILRTDGAGHAPHLEAPEEFTSLLEQFIADVG